MKINENGLLVHECEASKKYWNSPYYINKYNCFTIRKLREILTSEKDVFYASDFDIDGGTMNALANIRFAVVIDRKHHKFDTRFAFKPTGNYKTEMIEISDNFYKKVQVKEWKADKEVIKDFLEIYREEFLFAFGE